MTQTPRVPSAREWADYMQGEVVQLSRFPVVVGRVDPFDVMAEDATIPGVFKKMEALGVEMDADNIEDVLKMLPEVRPLLKRVVLAAVEEPTVIDCEAHETDKYDLDNNEIPLAWLTTTDRFIIFQKVFGGAAVLASRFLDEPDGSVAAVEDLDGIRAAARDAGGSDGER